MVADEMNKEHRLARAARWVPARRIRSAAWHGYRVGEAPRRDAPDDPSRFERRVAPNRAQFLPAYQAYVPLRELVRQKLQASLRKHNPVGDVLFPDFFCLVAPTSGIRKERSQTLRRGGAMSAGGRVEAYRKPRPPNPLGLPQDQQARCSKRWICTSQFTRAIALFQDSNTESRFVV